MKTYLSAIILLLCVAILTFATGISKRDLWAPDEPRFGQATREMLQRGDPFVLHVNNQPYTDKPPLQMWMGAAITLAQGSDAKVEPWAMRLPSVLGGIIGLIATYALGLALFGSTRIAFMGTLVLATMHMYGWQANRAQLDMLMAGWAIVAALAVHRAIHATSPTKAFTWWMLMWLMAALGTLSKGPPALIVPLGTAAFYLMWRHDPRLMRLTAWIWALSVLVLTLLAKIQAAQGWVLTAATGLVLLVWSVMAIRHWLLPRLRHNPAYLGRGLLTFFAGLILFLVVVGVWFVPYKMNAPASASQDTLVTQTVTRYFVGLNHVEPIWYYVEHIPVALLPWSLFFLAALWLSWRQDTSMKSGPRAFLTSWFLFTLVFFSLSPGKRDQYLLPSLPAYALFCGWFFDMLLSRRKDLKDLYWQIPAWTNAALALCLALAGIAFVGLRAHWGQNPPESILEKIGDAYPSIAAISATPLVLIGGGVLTYLLWAIPRKRILHVFGATAILMVTASAYTNLEVLPAIDPIKSGKKFTIAMSQHRLHNEPIAFYDLFRSQYILHADYFVTELDKLDKETPITKSGIYAFLENAENRVFIVMRDDQFEKVSKRYPELGLRKVFETRAGNRDMVVAENTPGLPKKASR